MKNGARGAVALTLVGLSCAALGRQAPGQPFGAGQTIGTMGICDRSLPVIQLPDIDGDGDPDILAGPCYAGGLVWHENDGRGGFANHVLMEPPTGVRGGGVEAVDLDGDGDLDILVTRDDEIFWFENDGSSAGAFTIHLVPTSTGAGIAHAFDMDGDGDGDILMPGDFVASDMLGQIGMAPFIIIENRGAGVFEERALGSVDFILMEVKGSDIDRDGTPDLLLHGFRPGDQPYTELEWSRGIKGSPPSFESPAYIDTWIGYRYLPLLADLDGDGDDDVIYESDVQLRWFENRTPASGGFLEHYADLILLIWWVYPIDFGGSGDLDLIASGREWADGAPWGIWLLENDGGRPPGFQPELLLEVEPGLVPQRVRAVDLDLDGDLDLIVELRDGAMGGRSRLVWYPNLAIHDSAARRAWRLYE